jgi:ubiquinone/menaquinone biosynthesis C-methylase UbiE
LDTLSKRIERERQHGKHILEFNESNWGWNTPAGQIRKQRRANFLTKLDENLSASSRVLEIGCGTGTFTGALNKVFKNLVCLDVSDFLLNEAKKKYPAVEFVNGDAHKTSFGDQSFDLIVGCSVLHHLDWHIALKEFKRLLKPGGRIRFSEPNLLNPQIFLQKNWPWLKEKLGDSPDEYAFTPSQIRKTLEQLEYTQIDAVPFDFLHPSTLTGLIKPMTYLGALLEKTPLRNIAGSIKISAHVKNS